MVERWQKNADGIILFVSHRLRIHIPTRINWNAVGRFILGRRGPATFRNGLGLEADSSASASRGLGLLSQEHMPGSLPSERLMSTPSLPC